MRMFHCGGLILIVLGIMVVSAPAQQLTTFSGGALSFDSVTNGRYAVEWISSVDYTNWSTNHPFPVLVATGSTTMLDLPLFYRVRWLNPPPHAITGFVRFAGVPLTGLVNQVELYSDGGVTSVLPGVDGSYSFNNVTNGWYSLSYSNQPYLAYGSSLEMLNDNQHQNIDLEVPLRPVIPTNHHAQSETTIVLSWANDPPTSYAFVEYGRVAPGVIPIHVAYVYWTNSFLVTNLAPGTYRWSVRAGMFSLGPIIPCSPVNTFIQVPLARFEEDQEFTITE